MSTIILINTDRTFSSMTLPDADLSFPSVIKEPDYRVFGKHLYRLSSYGSVFQSLMNDMSLSSFEATIDSYVATAISECDEFCINHLFEDKSIALFLKKHKDTLAEKLLDAQIERNNVMGIHDKDESMSSDHHYKIAKLYETRKEYDLARRHYLLSSYPDEVLSMITRLEQPKDILSQWSALAGEKEHPRLQAHAVNQCHVLIQSGIYLQSRELFWHSLNFTEKYPNTDSALLLAERSLVIGEGERGYKMAGVLRSLQSLPHNLEKRLVNAMLDNAALGGILQPSNVYCSFDNQPMLQIERAKRLMKNHSHISWKIFLEHQYEGKEFHALLQREADSLIEIVDGGKSPIDAVNSLVSVRDMPKPEMREFLLKHLKLCFREKPSLQAACEYSASQKNSSLYFNAMVAEERNIELHCNELYDSLAFDVNASPELIARLRTAFVKTNNVRDLKWPIYHHRISEEESCLLLDEAMKVHFQENSALADLYELAEKIPSAKKSRELIANAMIVRIPLKSVKIFEKEKSYRDKAIHHLTLLSGVSAELYYKAIGEEEYFLKLVSRSNPPMQLEAK